MSKSNRCGAKGRTKDGGIDLLELGKGIIESENFCRADEGEVTTKKLRVRPSQSALRRST